MSEPAASQTDPANASREEMMSALFAHLVMQQSNMAMMLLGKGAHPETGQTVKDIEAAKLFIDELEMLEVKTKGNLSREEAAFLKQNLMSLRLSFVEVVESSSEPPATPPQTGAPSQPEAREVNAPEKTDPAKADPPTGEDEHRKKFTKKY